MTQKIPPSRRAWWSVPEALAWIIFRSVSAVDEAERFKPDGEPDGPAPSDLALLALLKETLNRPYLSGPREYACEPWHASSQLDAAIKSGAVCEKNGRVRASDMRHVWPWRRRGRPAKQAFDTSSIERLSAHMRGNPRPKGIDRGALRAALPRELCLFGAGNKAEFDRFFARALQVATQYLDNRRRLQATELNSDLMFLEAINRQSVNLASWQIGRGRPSGSRNR